MIDGKRLYAVVGIAAMCVYVGALWNRFALDDVRVIVQDPLVHSPSGIWRAFLHPYIAGAMYRPLTVASYAIDWQLQSVAWYHAVNLLWHMATSVLVALLARRWIGATGALVAGLVFAVHPVHVEAVGNIVGRNELMAACFSLLAVYAALVRGSVGWSALALSLGMLCKENAAVVPGLIVWAWVLDLGRPTRRRAAAFVASWVVIAVIYAGARSLVLHALDVQVLAPVFVEQSRLTIRLTALAALADVARLLVFPLTLRVDYSPLERTAVTSLADPRLVLGVLCLGVWVALLVLAWRRGRRVEAFGLGWIALAFAPVANLLFPTGVLVAERTLYLPSVGLALAAGAWLERVSLPRRRLVPVVAVVVAVAGLRTALRVPVWRSDYTAVYSILQDSPRSYVGPKRMILAYLDAHLPARALEAALRASAINGRDMPIYVSGAVAAFAAGQPRIADSLLDRMEHACPECIAYYRSEAVTARNHGYPVAADSLEARAQRLGAP
jgi:hypothetical protein